MEDRLELRKLKKRDVALLAILLGIALGLLLWFWFGHQEQGEMVEVTVDGEIYGTYPLKDEQEISILPEGATETTNFLVITEGQADMKSADCPDKLCVHQAAISHVGETIVCLPNRVVVTIIGEETPQDPIVR